MSEIWMDVDTALASVPVNKLPLIDDTDFKTIEDAVVYNQAGLALFWNFTTTAGVTTVTAVTPTTAGVYDWTDFTTSGMYGIEIPASGGASANNDTEGFGFFTGVATGILPWAGPKIGFRAAAINNALIDGTALIVDSVTNAVGSVTGAVGSVTGHTNQTGDSFARIGATGSGLTSLAQASVLGALATAAATGDPTSAKTIMGYIKQLVNTMVGTAGIATFPAESAPGNAVSLAEVIRAIHADVTGLNGAAMRGTDGANTATPLTAAGVRTAVGLATANMDTQFAASATATGFATEAKQDAQDLIITEARLAELDAGNLPADIAAIPTVAEILTTQMTESYAADGAAPTLAQALMLIQQMLGDFTISGTTMTVRQVDGVTAAATFTLNNGTTPTALTRAT